MNVLHAMVKSARLTARAALLAAALAATMPLHVGHDEEGLNQKMPRIMRFLGARYEHIIMRVIDSLAGWDWLYDHRVTKWAVDTLSHAVMDVTHGEVLTLAESRELIESICEGGHTVAVGTCPCRRARNELSDDLPNNTDMVFGDWADSYLDTYPGLYRALSQDEAKRLVEQFDECGFLHQVYGFGGRPGAAFVLCNCDKSVCIPLLAQRSRGYQAFHKGRSLAAVSDACLGVEQCGACLARCPFGAREVVDGRSIVIEDDCFGCGLCVPTCKGGATTLSRKPGAQLLFTRHLVKS